MNGKIFSVIYVILVAISLVLLVLWLLNRNKGEGFTQQYFSSVSPEDLEDELESPIISARTNLFKGGLSGFFTDQKDVRSMPNFMQWIKNHVYVWPNSQDVCCATLEETPCNCDKFFINNSSCLDKQPYFFNTDFRKNIQSTLGSTHDVNCTMTILNNTYKLMRRSTELDVNNITTVTSPLDGNYFRLEVPSVKHLTLLRPLYISFNTIGLYEVMHEDAGNPTRANEFEKKKDANSFAYFDSAVDHGVIYLRPVDDSGIYPTKADNLARHFGKILDGKSMSCNIYYLSPETPLNMQDKVSKVFNFYINNSIYEMLGKKSAITFSLGNNINSNLARSVSISKSIDGNIQVSIDDEVYSYPMDFPFYEMERFDLMICYCYNTLLLVGFGEHKKKVRTIMIRHKVHKQFRWEYDNLKETFQSEAPKAFNSLINLYPLDIIPNFASIFDQLGYVY